MPAFNKERAAMILVDALYKGDEQAAQDWGVTRQTVRNYRRRLNSDTGLYSFFESKKALVEKDWSNEAQDAIRASVHFIRRAALRSKPSPEMVHAIAGALKIVSEAMGQKRLIDVRTAGNHRANGTEYRALASEFSNN